MKYGSTGRSKLLHAVELGAILSYLTLSQQDSVGFALFEDKLRYLVPPSSQISHLNQILHLLAICQPANLPSRIGPVLDELCGRWKQRSVVFLISDCFDDLDRLMTGLEASARYRETRSRRAPCFGSRRARAFPSRMLPSSRGSKVLRMSLSSRRGPIRTAYMKEFGAYLRELKLGCRSMDVDYELVERTSPWIDF